jgi:hypothetical protein
MKKIINDEKNKKIINDEKNKKNINKKIINNKI